MTPSRADKIQVLLVEDAVDHALLVQAAFQGQPDFALTHCQDGDQALRLLAERNWDLVIADLNLPGADGFQVIRAAKARSRHLPVLATTGYTQEHYWDQAFRAGADQVMVKPLGKDDLLARVRALLPARAAVGAPRGGEAAPRGNTVLVVEGRLGDGIMGCAGACAASAAAGAQIVVLPVPVDTTRVDPGQYGAAKAAARTLGFTVRLAEALVGDADAMELMLERAVTEIGPTVVYAPARGDRDPARAAASALAARAARGRVRVYGYPTATTPTSFTPHRIVDVAPYLDRKAEALAHFAVVGGARPDLAPDLARATARHWGRLKDFGQVEVFEIIQEKHP